MWQENPAGRVRDRLGEAASPLHRASSATLAARPSPSRAHAPEGLGGLLYLLCFLQGSGETAGLSDEVSRGSPPHPRSWAPAEAGLRGRPLELLACPGCWLEGSEAYCCC